MIEEYPNFVVDELVELKGKDIEEVYDKCLSWFRSKIEEVNARAMFLHHIR